MRPNTTGAIGEAAAAKHLKQNRYRILARNLRNRFGEIDIVALTPGGNTLVIVEVKAAIASDALPELRVDHHKQRRLTALAAQLLRRYRMTQTPVRFDVIAVTLPDQGKPQLRHHKAAFESHI